MTWLELATLLVAALWNLGSYLLPQLAATPGLGLRQAALESHASTAVGSLLPAGQAVGLGVTYRFYTSYGFDSGPITLSLLVQGVWNNFVKLGMPIVALGLLVVSGDAADGLGPAAVVGLVVFLLALAGFAFGLSGERRAARLGRALAGAAAAMRRLVRRPGRPDWEHGAVAFRAQAITLLRGRWHWLTLTTLTSHLSLFLVLLLALRHVGVSESEVSWVEALAAFALVRPPSAFPVTPGGLGVVELGLAAALVPPAARRPRWWPRCWCSGCSPSRRRSRSAPSPGGGGAAARAGGIGCRHSKPNERSASGRGADDAAGRGAGPAGGAARCTGARCRSGATSRGGRPAAAPAAWSRR